MKFPICKKCLNEELLCETCANVVGESLIKADEINLYRKFEKISRKYGILKDVEIKRMIESGNLLLILADKKNTSRIIGKNGGMISQLSQDLDKQIRVLTTTQNLENFVRELLYSIHVLGINVVYSPEGDKYKIRLPISEKKLLPIDEEKFSKIMESFFKVDAQLVFE